MIKLDKYDYDIENDNIFFYNDSGKYEFSVDIDGIIFDIDENNHIMAIEILDASKKIKSSKSDLRDINCFDINVIINNKK